MWHNQYTRVPVCAQIGNIKPTPVLMLDNTVAKVAPELLQDDPEELQSWRDRVV